jgi:hypothetical protein
MCSGQAVGEQQIYYDSAYPHSPRQEGAENNAGQRPK